jgi:transglutaminase-like putative cysteine protease
MKKRFLLLLILLCLPVAYAEYWYFNSETVELNLNIHSDINVIKEKANAQLKELKVNLSFFPKDTAQQDTSSLLTEPQAEEHDTFVEYTWNNPSETNLEFSLASDIKLYNKQVKVKNKISFPLTTPSELSIYTKPSFTIDSDDPSIFALANNLAEGEDDLYQVVFNLAQWTKNNIEYDLSTLTADATQSSSWVLDTRQGVCDELTNLFIALNRALGIPAKFISGISYTNSPEFPEPWGPHGWAEVYFPGYGWIPFDVTYGQFGYIDPTHIKLKESLDASDASTKYIWLGNNIDIQTNSLEFDVTLKEYKGAIPNKIALNLEPIKNSVAFGSYNLVEATIINLKDYYQSNELSLSRPVEVDIIGEERIQVLLKPNEEKKVYWVIKISDNLEKNFIYTFPLTTYSLENTSTSTLFTSTEADYFYNLDEINEILDLKNDLEEKVYSKDVKLDCTVDDNELYEYETAYVTCNIKNNGNILLENMDLCLDEDCEKLTLGISKEQQKIFDFNPIKKGEYELLVGIKGENILANQMLKVNVLDIPSIDIINITHPEKVSFKDKYGISFILNKKSVSFPKDVVIELNEEGFKKTWDLTELSNDKKFEIPLEARDLSVGENKIDIKLTFYDYNGKEYKTEESFIIELNKVSVIERVQIFFTDIAKFIGRLFD